MVIIRDYDLHLKDTFISPCCNTILVSISHKGLQCQNCKEVFPCLDNTIDFIPQKYTQLKQVKDWNEIQKKYYLRNPNVMKTKSKEKYQRYIKYHQEFLMEFCNLHGKTLDIGCGPMNEHLNMINPGNYTNLEYYGIDPMLSFVDECKANVFRAVAEMLPFKNGYFDSVFMISVLDHIILPKLALKEIARVLKDDGTLFISLAMRNITWKSKLRKRLFRNVRIGKHVTDFNEKMLMKHLLVAEFLVNEKRRSNIVPNILFLQAKKRNKLA